MPNAGLHWSNLPTDVLALLRRGVVIPAHPLALDPARQFDRVSQRALTRYYIDAGAGGLAVGVHSTQFTIRDVGLYRPVLELAAESAAAWTDRPLVMIAGAIGRTAQASRRPAWRARSAITRCCFARGHEGRQRGRDRGALRGRGGRDAADRLLPAAAVGGIALSRAFWTRFAAIENVVAIKVAPFNRYGTLDVAFGVVAAGAEERVTLYTGNDDHIVADLVTPFASARRARGDPALSRAGCSGHWSVWTKGAVALLDDASGRGRGRRNHARDPGARLGRHRTATASSSTSRTISPAASRAATRYCAARA
jgi:hypothetical protein